MSFTFKKKLERIFKLPNLRGEIPGKQVHEIDEEFRSTQFYGIIGSDSYFIKAFLNPESLDDTRELIAYGEPDSGGTYPVIHVCFDLEGKLTDLREYLRTGTKTSHMTRWNFRHESQYLEGLSIADQLVDDFFEHVQSLPKSRFFAKRVSIDDTMFEKLEWLKNNPSLPREVNRSDTRDDIRRSTFFNIIGKSGYRAEIDPSIMKKGIFCNITATAQAGIDTLLLEISFDAKGKVAALKEEIISTFKDSTVRNERDIMPSWLPYNHQLSAKIAEQIVNDMIFNSRVITHQKGQKR